MNKNSLTDFLNSHANEGVISFHMPGHKGGKIFEKYGYTLDLSHDITEIPGADNLFKAEGVLQNVANRYADLYEVKKSYLLINGSSVGIIAAILTIAKENDSLIVARNCHKAVFNALRLGKINPVFAYPDENNKITPEEVTRCFEKAPDAVGLIFTYPTYHGEISKIKEIEKIVHARDKVLIIDQAHGAHLKFFEKFTDRKIISGETAGADIIINSVHKTLASFTQSSILNVNSEKINLNVLEDRLQMLQSSSPSYLLMESLDINAKLLEDHGKELIQEWNSNLDNFYNKTKNLNIFHEDPTKIIVLMTGKMTGYDLERELQKRKIQAEMADNRSVCLMSGIGNSKKDYEKLAEELTEICEEAIIPYPPGIPLVYPGEVITDEIKAEIEELKKNNITILGLPKEKKMQNDRPSWDEYFMSMAELAMSRSTCLRRKVGAVIVRNQRIMATGYNGVPTGIEHCDERGCLREKMKVPSGKMHELCRGLHAEQNAIIQAAHLGQSIAGGELYCTNQPCIICAKMIINAGIKRIIIRDGYPDELALEMLNEAGIKIDVLKKGEGEDA